MKRNLDFYPEGYGRFLGFFFNGRFLSKKIAHSGKIRMSQLKWSWGGG